MSPLPLTICLFWGSMAPGQTGTEPKGETGKECQKQIDALPKEVVSRTGRVSVDDLKKFRPGQSKAELLENIQWRAGQVYAGICDGKAVMLIDFDLHVDPAADYRR